LVLTEALIGPDGVSSSSWVSWESAPLEAPIELAGPIELRLDATTTAADADWIAVLQAVDADGTTHDITGGWLRASLPDAESRQRRPVPADTPVAYRIALVQNARHVAAGQRLRLTLLGDDSPPDAPALLNFRHTPLGLPARQTVHASSRLVLSQL
jgi:predicted acyl esterase